jgi:hypothetical protein
MKIAGIVEDTREISVSLTEEVLRLVAGDLSLKLLGKFEYEASCQLSAEVNRLTQVL